MIIDIGNGQATCSIFMPITCIHGMTDMSFANTLDVAHTH